MAELDSLIDSKISLISQEDVKFDGTLFSINAEESSMVLKNGEIAYMRYDLKSVLFCFIYSGMFGY